MRREELLKRIEQEKQTRHHVVLELSKTKKEIERLTKLQAQLEFELNVEDGVIKAMQKDLKEVD